MIAKQLQINEFLQTPNVQFVIPVYQRNYDWGNSECRRLLNDIILVGTKNEGSHFIGSIVYIHEGTFNISDVKELVIIDGQQRLTTISILYVALYRFAKENGDENNANRLYEMVLTNKYVNSKTKEIKLKQTDLNSVAYNAIISASENELDEYSNVKENFIFFKNTVNRDNFDILLNGLNRLIFVEISLERDKDDPQRIFESLNSTGLDLSQSDLIRNFILMDLPPKEQNRIFETIWNPIEKNARDIIRKQSKVSDYIRDYLTLRNKKIPNKSKVYEEFKNLYENRKDEAYQQELENIKSLSFHYKKFINPSTIKEVDIRKEMEYINRLEINVAYPFLLQLFEDADNGLIEKAEFIKVLKLIQSYTWRRFVVGLPTGSLNKIFMTLYSEVDTEEYYESVAIALLKKRGRGKFPTNEELRNALKDKDLYNTQSKNKNYMFEMLENFNNREHVNTSIEDITIEHIFPQNPSEQWAEELLPEEYFAFKEKHLNTIANLTLSGNNGALSNRSFIEKKEMNVDEKEQGYLYSRLWLNSYLKEIDSWDISKYKERFNIIYNRFLKVWEYPDVDIEEDDETEEENIFDAESPTHKKLEYFIFENTKVEETAIARMYFYVIECLYEKNSQLLVSNQDILKITRNSHDFRAPQELTNGWYIEANIDSNTKFSVLKKLLTLFELEEELLIKYSLNGENQTTPSRFAIRRKYWEQLLSQLESTSLFENVSPTKEHWLSAGGGIGGVAYTLSISKSYVRIELSISTSSKERNKAYFNKLFRNKDAIENAFGNPLVWEELPDNKMSRIKYEDTSVNLFDERYWSVMNQFIISNLPKFENVLSPFIQKLK